MSIDYNNMEQEMVDWVKNNPKAASVATAHFLSVMWDEDIVRLYNKVAQEQAGCPVIENNRG